MPIRAHDIVISFVTLLLEAGLYAPYLGNVILLQLGDLVLLRLQLSYAMTTRRTR